MECLELQDARLLIAEVAAEKRREELVPLLQVLGRVPTGDLPAKIPKPAYDQSTRDGYVFPSDDLPVSGGGRWYTIGGEIPAGSTGKITFTKGVAYRIMTGGLVPEKSLCVVAQEDCQTKDNQVFITTGALTNPMNCIRRTGCVFQPGDTVVKAGSPVSVDQMALLAETGHDCISVLARPRVAYFCSGSELVSDPSQIRKGLKLSTNRFILDGVIRGLGCTTEDLGGISDNVEAVTELLKRASSSDWDVVVSTGGMGPGKYDFMVEAFLRAGGQVLYRSLNVRPGKSTLFGSLGKTLFFALPGPPPAVRTLLNELLRPALLSLQGIDKCQPRKVAARLMETITLKKSGIINIKAGVLSLVEGKIYVRSCGKLESPSGYMLLGGERVQHNKGDLVEVHLMDSPFTDGWPAVTNIVHS